MGLAVAEGESLFVLGPTSPPVSLVELSAASSSNLTVAVEEDGPRPPPPPSDDFSLTPPPQKQHREGHIIKMSLFKLIPLQREGVFVTAPPPPRMRRPLSCPNFRRMSVRSTAASRQVVKFSFFRLFSLLFPVPLLVLYKQHTPAARPFAPTSLARLSERPSCFPPKEAPPLPPSLSCLAL